MATLTEIRHSRMSDRARRPSQKPTLRQKPNFVKGTSQLMSPKYEHIKSNSTSQ